MISDSKATLPDHIEVHFGSYCIRNDVAYIQNDAAIDQVVATVRDGRYCSILGPRYCQKSFLLEDVKAALVAKGHRACLLINLEMLVAVPDSEFLNSFANLVSACVGEALDVEPPSSLSEVKDERSLQRFLKDYAKEVKQDLVLLIDHLERVRMGPLKSLLLALRAVYIERKRDENHRLVIVTASSLRIAGLALGPSSPFNIAHVVLVPDLSPDESHRLIDLIINRKGILVAPRALERLISATEGDRYLISKLLDRCIDLIRRRRGGRITERLVEQAMLSFLEDEASKHGPLQEMIRTLEADTTSLMNILKILEDKEVSRRQLGLEIVSDMDELQLTGAVTVKESGGERFYRIRNEVYRFYLQRHFHTDRVVQVLSMAGEWEQAIEYLGGGVSDAPRRRALLGVIVDYIYAAYNESEACGKLANWLKSAFAISKARIYIVSPERSRLKLVSQSGFKATLQDLPLSKDTLPEIKAFRSNQHEVTRTVAGEQMLLIPLTRNEKSPLGLAVIHGFEANPEGDDFLELLAFIKQISRAVGAVIDRERKYLQLATLYDTGKQLTTSLNLKQVLQTTVESAIKAVPGAQRGALFIWDEKEEKLILKAQKNLREGIEKEVRLGREEGYAGKVFASGQAVLIEDATKDKRVIMKWVPDVKKQKSVICVPLEAWGQVIGVLCLDNTTEFGVFLKEDLNLLSTFASQAALAIQNARLYTELAELGMLINQGEVSHEEIIQYTIQSITRVSAAKGANMLLLPKADSQQLDQPPYKMLSVSTGMPADYDKKIRPRPEGLTDLVLRTGQPIYVSSPDVSPGINELARNHGIQADIGLPMMIRDRIIGVLFVHYDKPHTFSKSEIAMLSVFTNQAALAIENKRLLGQLKASERSLAQQEALRQTSRMVAHRLRNVLPYISDRIDRILNQHSIGSEVAVWATNALEESRRAQMIIRDFETFSRAEVFDLPDVLSGPELVEKLSQFIKDDIKQPGAQVITRCEPGLPPVRLNLHLLSYDFANFVNDSQRHKPQGLCIGLSCELANEKDLQQVGLQKRASYLKVVYADNGPGIPPDIKGRVFDAFYTTTGGSGLGLAIATHNARVHGGALVERGQPGEGVRFEMYLPVANSSR